MDLITTIISGLEVIQFNFELVHARMARDDLAKVVSFHCLTGCLPFPLPPPPSL